MVSNFGLPDLSTHFTNRDLSFFGKRCFEMLFLLLQQKTTHIGDGITSDFEQQSNQFY